MTISCGEADDGRCIDLVNRAREMFEVDPVKTGERVANFALAVLAKGRIPRPPKITLQYVFGATFPF